MAPIYGAEILRLNKFLCIDDADKLARLDIKYLDFVYNNSPAAKNNNGIGTSSTAAGGGAFSDSNSPSYAAQFYYFAIPKKQIMHYNNSPPQLWTVYRIDLRNHPAYFEEVATGADFNSVHLSTRLWIDPNNEYFYAICSDDVQQQAGEEESKWMRMARYTRTSFEQQTIFLRGAKLAQLFGAHLHFIDSNANRLLVMLRNQSNLPGNHLMDRTLYSTEIYLLCMDGMTKNGHNHFVDALKIILPDLPTRFAEYSELISGSDWRFYELDWEIRAISLPEDNEERSKENYDGNCCYYFECGNNVLFYNLGTQFRAFNWHKQCWEQFHLHNIKNQMPLLDLEKLTVGPRDPSQDLMRQVERFHIVQCRFGSYVYNSRNGQQLLYKLAIDVHSQTFWFISTNFGHTRFIDQHGQILLHWEQQGNTLQEIVHVQPSALKHLAYWAIFAPTAADGNSDDDGDGKHGGDGNGKKFYYTKKCAKIVRKIPTQDQILNCFRNRRNQ